MKELSVENKGMEHPGMENLWMENLGGNRSMEYLRRPNLIRESLKSKNQICHKKIIDDRKKRILLYPDCENKSRFIAVRKIRNVSGIEDNKMIRAVPDQNGSDQVIPDKSITVSKTIRGFVCLLMLVGFIVFVLRYRAFIILSGSMENGIPAGSVVLVDTFHKDVKAGDIITWQSGDQRITHRIFARTDKGFITKGDANKLPDAGFVRETDIIGIVCAVIPCLGKVLLRLRNPLSICLLVFGSFPVILKSVIGKLKTMSGAGS